MKTRTQQLTYAGEVTGLLVLGGLGGLMALAAGLPMPFLTGGLTLTGLVALVLSNRFGRDVRFPQTLRMIFIAVIGAMIGASFRPDLLSFIPSIWISLLAMALFVAVAYVMGYVFFRRIGGYDRVTALFSAMPGGLVEAVTLGEQAGGDVRILSLQHFARVILVVLVVPFGFQTWSGEAVGSAAGQTLSASAYAPSDVVIIGLLAAVGLYLGHLLRLPAGQMMGPMILSAVVHGIGIVEVTNPPWLLNMAQLFIGVALGALFAGSSLALLGRTFGLGIISVGLMLCLSLLFAYVLAPLVPIEMDALFISFAPGGMTEMGLIALSLNISPVVVAIHHLFRITFTVGASSLTMRLGQFKQKT